MSPVDAALLVLAVVFVVYLAWASEQDDGM